MRKSFDRPALLLMLLAIGIVLPAAGEPRPMEQLDRGLVGLRTDDGVFLSWRLLGTEPTDMAFDIYRQAEHSEAVKLNAEPLLGPTCFIDKSAQTDLAYTYSVRGHDASAAGGVGVFDLPSDHDKPYLALRLKTPEGYKPNDASVADLDGDGQYEIILHQAGRGKDNSHNGVTDPPILQAYKLDGTLLWEINLGPNIREGAHYTQFLVYDLDNDGYAEMVVKTADGSKDAQGRVIGDPDANYVDKGGRILAGPEYLTVFDGHTGAAIDTVPYTPKRGITTDNPTGEQMKRIWGDSYGNRMDRFLGCVAYLDGQHASVVMSRGYYTRTFLAAWDFRDGKLVQRWVFDSGAEGNEGYGEQGNHGLSVNDVDGDGRDEIIFGGMALDDDGTGLYSTGLGHGDAMHVSDLDPTRPGMEVFRIQERFDDAGAHMFDAATGNILWKKPSISKGKDGEGPGRGLALDVDPRFPGAECWVAGAGINGMFDARGQKIADVTGDEIYNTTPSVNMGVWWDGDLLRELLDGTKIRKWNWESAGRETLLASDEYNCISNNWTKANPCLSADILGDWREEVIWPTKDGNELRIFTTTIPTDYRFFTLMHDPQYRLSVAWQNVGYNQPPHTSFFFGHGMSMPPRPNITLITPSRADAVSIEAASR